MRQHKAVVLALLVVAAGGCLADPAPEPVAGRVEWIVDGTRESGEPQTVAVVNVRGGLCTGSLIAPRVVLTAKHCVQQAGADEPDAPSYFRVRTGGNVWRPDSEYSVQQVRTTPGRYTSGGAGGLGGALVGVDVALLTLERGITAFAPYPIRRESPSDLVGEEAIVIGYGQTPSGDTGNKYKGSTVVRSVMGGVIYTGASTCQGDSGGPIIDAATGEVFGITSFGTGGCGSGYAGFNRIDTFLDLIDEAIRDSGTCVNDGEERCDGYDNDCNDEVDETCFDLGEACELGDECKGNYCTDTEAGRICTVECDPLRPSLTCPPGLYCARTEGCDGLCLPLPDDRLMLGNDADCTRSADCVSLFCADPGDGRQRCLTPCRGDAGMCLAGEACAATAGACNGCVPAEIVIGSRSLGEPCRTGDECGSGSCIEDGGARYCTRECADDGGCPDGFHCRDAACIRGDREGVGSGCLENADCLDDPEDSRDGICASRGEDTRWCTSFCDPDDPAACPEDFSCVTVGEGVAVCAPDRRLVGESCESAEDCISSLCADGPEGSVCTVRCGSDAPCSPGFECRRTADGTDAVCLAPRPEATSGGDGCSCSVPGGAGPGAPWPFALLALGFILFRRWR